MTGFLPQIGFGQEGFYNPQFAQWNIFAAIEAFGPMASRPDDRMGVAGWYNGLSDLYVDDVEFLAGISLRDTWGFEI